MGTVVAVTRNGRGKCLLFTHKVEARLCPLVQYHDPVFSSGSELSSYLSKAQVERLLPEGYARLSVARALSDWADRALEQIIEIAEKPSRDPSEIVRVIIEDRKAMEGQPIFIKPEREESSMSEGGGRKGRKREAAAEDGAVNDAGAVENTEAEKKVSSRGIPRENVIHAKNNAEGVSYFQANPKKPGKKNYERFGKLYDGITVGQALDAGVTMGDLHYDTQHGFIVIREP